jgi:hypothetical protein
MIKLDVPMVLFDLGYSGTPGLSNINLHTLVGDAVYARCFQAKVILDGMKKIGNLLRWGSLQF